MTSGDKIKDQFVNRGYVELSRNKIPKSLLWQPDFLFSKDGYIYLVLLKSNNSVLPVYLNRIATVPKGNYVPLIVFGQKPRKSDYEAILALGISIGLLTRGRLSHLKIKRKRPQKIVQKEIKKKLEVIDIFLSSKQEIDERRFVEERLEILRKINSYPFNPPHLIEHDKFKPAELYEYINNKIDICEWIIIILEDNYSDDVSYELNRAIKTIPHENIFMFVKSTSACKSAWKKELIKMKKLENSIKYIPYSDKTELEVYLSRSIKKRINEICKQNGIKMFE